MFFILFKMSKTSTNGTSYDNMTYPVICNVFFFLFLQFLFSKQDLQKIPILHQKRNRKLPGGLHLDGPRSLTNRIPQRKKRSNPVLHILFAEAVNSRHHHCIAIRIVPGSKARPGDDLSRIDDLSFGQDQQKKNESKIEAPSFDGIGNIGLKQRQRHKKTVAKENRTKIECVKYGGLHIDKLPGIRI